MATFIVGAILAGCVGLASHKVYKDHKKGACGCGCSGCSQKDQCH